jgi:hypothetical protein
MLLFANRARADCTNYVAEIQDAVSTATGLLSVAYHDLTNNPAPTIAQRRQAAAIKRAFVDLKKPTAPPAVSYKFFVAATLHLGSLASQPPFSEAGSNIFKAFMNETRAEIDCTSERITTLNNFVRTKKPASNQLEQAQAALDSISSLAEARAGLFVGRRVFAKIDAANKLAAIAEAHPGFAPNSVVGANFDYGVVHGHSGYVAFTNSTQWEGGESTGPRVFTTDEGTYLYDRTGLNTAQLVVFGSGITRTAHLTFRSSTDGTFTATDATAAGVQRLRGDFALH